MSLPRPWPTKASSAEVFAPEIKSPIAIASPAASNSAANLRNFAQICVNTLFDGKLGIRIDEKLSVHGFEFPEAQLEDWRVSDKIVAVAGHPVGSVEEFAERLQDAKHVMPIVFTVERKHAPVVVPPPKRPIQPPVPEMEPLYDPTGFCPSNGMMSRTGPAPLGIAAQATVPHLTALLNPAATSMPVGVCPAGHPLDPLGVTNTGWLCDNYFSQPEGCLSGLADYHQTNGLPTFRCDICDYDLCEKCFWQQLVPKPQPLTAGDPQQPPTETPQAVAQAVAARASMAVAGFARIAPPEGTAAFSSGGPPEAKWPRTLMEDVQDANAMEIAQSAHLGALETSTLFPPVPCGEASDEAPPAEDPDAASAPAGDWAEVFAQLRDHDLEPRAGEYADGVVALRKQRQKLLREHSATERDMRTLLLVARQEAAKAKARRLVEQLEHESPPDVVTSASIAAKGG